MDYYLAVDIGASSGRHILGYLEDGKLKLEEVYRFQNQMTEADGSLVWDIEGLTGEVLNGLRACRELGRIPKTVAIDTWGVDYVLLDESRREILPVYAYRDGRTQGIVKEVEDLLSAEELYARTGIQKQNFNTIYQLFCDRQSGRLERAKHFLMMPEYLAFRLTGKRKNEYTNATTTGLIHAESHDWDGEILGRLGIPQELFETPSLPGTAVGNFTPEVAKAVGFEAQVILCPTHDTASAVAACPLGERDVYLSSGTWSLIGMENREPVLTEESRAANFTNEGGIGYRFRFLKNIAGMWMFQNIRKNLGKRFSYDEMMEMAMKSSFRETIDVNAEEFSAPPDMIEAIRSYLGCPELPLGDVLNAVYHSLAKEYARSVRELEALTGKEARCIHIVGGGCVDVYLNKLTREYTGKPVFAGPKEATATGNILSQMMAEKAGFELENARELVRRSFEIKEI